MAGIKAKPAHALFRQIAKLKKYPLEIFLIHVYRFIHPTGNTWVNLGISVSIVMLAAMVVHDVEKHVSERLFAR